VPISCISLGSNLDDPQQQILSAIENIKSLPDTNLIKQSTLLETEPWGLADQPNFYNAIALIETELTPMRLLEALQKIELDAGRVRKEKWGPRILDLDIICYGDTAIYSPELTIPHPSFSEREFVLKPLVDIYPDCLILGRPVTEWLAMLLESKRLKDNL